jgi:hypothetical protein
MYIDAASHLCIILGEAIIVMFFLHVIIEQQHHGDHMQKVEQSIQSLIHNIQRDLFAAIMKDKMPHDLIRLMLEGSFFKPTFLRRKLKVYYNFLDETDNKLRMTQRIEFDMDYVLGEEAVINYPMGFSMSDSPLATYTFKEGGFRRYKEDDTMNNLKRYTKDDFEIRERGTKKEKDFYALKNEITMKKSERIHVYQIIEISFPLQGRGVVDNYFVNHHTLGADIEIVFPNEYEFEIYPTFDLGEMPEPMTMGSRKVYENIKFLLPGQGWGYSILRKN